MLEYFNVSNSIVIGIWENCEFVKMLWESWEILDLVMSLSGTTVGVLKLFKHLPVRRQYYANVKKCKEELKNVQDLLMAYAIIKPELRLTLTHNKVLLLGCRRISLLTTSFKWPLGDSKFISNSSLLLTM